MEYRQQIDNQDKDQVIEDLERMRRFAGPPAEFWPAFLESAARLAEAMFGLLLAQGEDEGAWRNLCTWPAGDRRILKASNLSNSVEEIAEQVVREGSAWTRIESAKRSAPRDTALGVRIDLEEERACVAIFLLANGSVLAPEEAVTRLKLVSDVPAVYQLGRLAQQAKNDVVQFAEALDLMVLINAESRYMAAAMTFCNELASRYRCTRVSLGWLKGGYVRVQAISHMERFEKKMDAVQTLEAAMEEAFDQDEEILWPRPKESTCVTRDHESFARDLGVNHIVSLPLRLDGEPTGVVTCERVEEPFSEVEVRGLRLLCDQAARRLGDLKRHDRWFGARMATSVRESLSKLLGVEHTLAKCIGVIVCVALAILLFGKMTYRVESPFILRTDDLAYIPAPFDGYIDRAPVMVGDLVEEGDILLTLDTRELMLEESMAIADQSRYAREAEKARAKNTLAEMRIAQALEAQSKSKLDLIRYRLGNAEMRSPFSGIVVEGDLKELLGAPVRKGDVLFKVARIEKMYAELEVNERDVHDVDAGMTGEIAFVSRPDLKFPILVERVEPVALAKEEGNVFILRGEVSGDPATWWRPGMSGISKINVRKENILWILTHHTIDFIRILLWW